MNRAAGLACVGVLMASACAGPGPSAPGLPTASSAPAPPAPTPTATATPAPAATAEPAASADRNSAPEISGLDTCISEPGHEHVFDLTLRDPDGDEMSWRAAKEEPRGVLDPASGPLVPSGSTIQVRYRPPAGGDENRIRVFVTDTRGATTRMMLYTRNH
jgi:hypothetical protein